MVEAVHAGELRAGVDGGFTSIHSPLGFAAALKIKLLKIFKFFRCPWGGKWLRGGGLGRTGSSRDCPPREDRGEPGEGQRLSVEAPHPRSADQKPLEQDLGLEAWGRRSEGRAGGTGSAASGLRALGSPAHTQACWPLSGSPVNTKDHTPPPRETVARSPGWGRGVDPQPGQESE